jgi:hypothetical protein
VTSDVPADSAGSAIRIAAFIGKDYRTTPQFVQTDPIPVR